MDYDRMGGLKVALLGFTALVAAFLLFPVVFIVLLSFGSSRWLAFPPPGWTLKCIGSFSPTRAGWKRR